MFGDFESEWLEQPWHGGINYTGSLTSNLCGEAQYLGVPTLPSVAHA